MYCYSIAAGKLIALVTMYASYMQMLTAKMTFSYILIVICHSMQI